MKINWKVRFKNPLFIAQLFLAIAVPIGAYFGIAGSDITSWTALGKVIVDAISNPYVLFTVLISLYNATIDPTTKGLTDSNQALNYHEPK
ncbi:phage holin [Streptomyces sp. NPDC057927]